MDFKQESSKYCGWYVKIYCSIGPDGLTNKSSIWIGDASDQSNFTIMTCIGLLKAMGLLIYLKLNITKAQFFQPIQLKGYTVDTLPAALLHDAYCTDLLASWILSCSSGWWC